MITPKRNGRQLAAVLTETRPEMKVLFVSGYIDGITRDGVHEMLEGGFAFLQKPYTHHALSRKIREIIDSKAAGQSAQ
jgi:FixJ family two-component response regulator